MCAIRSNTNAYSHCYCHTYIDANADPKADSNTAAASDAGAASVALTRILEGPEFRERFANPRKTAPVETAV